MKPKTAQRLPALTVLGVLLLLVLLRLVSPDFLERLELLTYDSRVRFAARPANSNHFDFGFVSIDEQTVTAVRDGSLGYRFGLYWPRQIYGRLVDQLKTEAAKAIAFDVIFGELRSDHPPVQMRDGTLLESDDYFVMQLRRAGNVILATTPDLSPPESFSAAALACADIATDKDSDGVLRRVRAFRTYREWHPAFRQVEADPGFGVNLRRSVITKDAVILKRLDGSEIRVPLDEEGNFSLSDFGTVPEGVAPTAKPFTERQIWHMGIVLASMVLGAELESARILTNSGRIILRGSGGLTRVIPIDEDGFFYINWRIPPNSTGLLQEAAESLLARHRDGLEGPLAGLSPWAGKIAIIGSGAMGNDLTDRGATPLLPETLLVSKHWNVADAIIKGAFVHRISIFWDLCLIVLTGAAVAWLTWRLKPVTGFCVVMGLVVLYTLLAFLVYSWSYLWIPIVLPVLGSLVLMHLALLVWRVVFEQAERRRIRGVFSKMVSPKIVKEVLSGENMALGGARREITVLFADIRGFTEFTDVSLERVAELVRREKLEGDEAEACFSAQARETLATVNLYIGLIADTIIHHDGTLDKFIGDCVMAFWGAPTPNPRHAAACVKAAVSAQRAIAQLNRDRQAENERRAAENERRLALGLNPQEMLPVLKLGTGINTGMATVGLMGSEAETRNYTVFGREVNLASRLESVSGHGRIIISEATMEHLRRDAPELADTCIALEPVIVKGIRQQVKIYEVPWQQPSNEPQGSSVSSPLAAPSPAS